MNWTAKVREEGSARADALGAPGPKHEGWRLIDASGLRAKETAAAVTASEPDIGAYALPEALRIVFVDGRYSEALSKLGDEAGVSVAPLGMEEEALHAHFGSSLKDEYYAQLNIKHFVDCAFVHVTGEADLPIHMLHVGTSGTSHARCLVVLEANARATLIEEYVGDGFVNAVTEVVLGDHAFLRHVRLQEDVGLHVGNTDVKLGMGAECDSTALSMGGKLSRHYLHVAHLGERAEVLLDGLNLSDDRQVVDVHTKVDHLVPNCKTVQRHKCIAGGASASVFSGNIVVHRDAKGTETKQENRNLLLSGRAKIDAQPELEILNDDVSCKHGATVGRLDEEELFYLKSRGLNEDLSRKLLVYAFAAEIVDRIPVASLVNRLREMVTGRLA